MSLPDIAMPASTDREIRILSADDLHAFTSHLLRLDPASRRDRFNGVTDDEYVTAYAATCFEGETVVIGYGAPGRVEAAAELHQREDGNVRAAEIAFSVESHLQNRGLGSRLFERLISIARSLGYRELTVTTHSQNEAMKALARKFDASLSFERSEAVGLILLRDDTARGGVEPKHPAVRPKRPFDGFLGAVAAFRAGRHSLKK